MHKDADTIDGVYISAEEARIRNEKAGCSLQYRCSSCGTIMHLVVRKGTVYFACHPRHPHRKPGCKRREDSQKTQTLFNTDFRKLIQKQSAALSEKEKSEPPVIRPVQPPTVQKLNYEADIDLAYIADRGYHYKLKPDTDLGGCKASDFMIFYPWRWTVRNFPGGECIIMARTMHILQEKGLILLKSWWTDNDMQLQEQIFCLEFSAPELFVEYAKKLFPGKVTEKGTTDRIKAKNDILVMGIWSWYTYRGENQLKCTINRRSQIYICP